MSTLAFIILAGVVAFLALRLYETREQVRRLRRVVGRLVDTMGTLVDITTEETQR